VGEFDLSVAMSERFPYARLGEGQRGEHVETV